MWIDILVIHDEADERQFFTVVAQVCFALPRFYLYHHIVEEFDLVLFMQHRFTQELSICRIFAEFHRENTGDIALL